MVDKIFDFWDTSIYIDDEDYTEISLKEYILSKIDEYLDVLRIDYLKELVKKDKEKKEKKEKQDVVPEQIVKSIEKKEVVVEPPIHINNFDKIKDIYDRYENIFPRQIYNETYDEFYTLNEIKGLLLFSYGDFDIEQFHAGLSSIFYNLHKENDEDMISMYHNIMNELCRKFEVRERIDYTDRLIRKMWSQFYIEDESMQMKLEESRAELNYLYENNVAYSIADQTLDKIKKDLHNIRSKLTDSNKDHIELRSFILFDYYLNDDGETVPYILNDLDENNNRSLIDKSLDKNKLLIDGYYDFNELMDDFLTIGDARITQDALDGISKLIRPVYYTTSEYDYIKDKAENATGMIRIRPTLSSYVRFIDEKIKFEPSNQEKMKQIKELMESKFKNVHIDETKPFALYINILTSFKMKDGSIYKLAINRQRSTSFRNLIDSFNKKELLSNEDLELISGAIDMSILTFKQLKKMNENFEFKTINKLTNYETYR